MSTAEWKRTCGSGRWELDLVVLVLQLFFLDFAELRTLQLGGVTNLQRGSGVGGAEESMQVNTQIPESS